MHVRILRSASLLLSLLVLFLPLDVSAATPARTCLDQAAAAARRIELGGDQSAARRDIALLLAREDAAAAGELTATITRPSDVARALAAVAAAQFGKDPNAAKATALAGAQQLTRIAEQEKRLEAERQYLGEVALLGAEAPALVPELPAEEARAIVVAGLAETKPAEALKLVQGWQLAGRSADRALTVLALRLDDPDQALDLASRISSLEARDETLLRIAEKRPPAEAAGIVQRVQDPVERANLLARAALRLAQGQPEAGLEAARSVEVSPASAQAELAAGLADDATAAAIARALPGPARRWALARIALATAASKPEQAEKYLKESGDEGDAARVVIGKLASVDRERALRLARALPAGEARDAGLAAVAEAMVMYDARAAADLALEVTTPRWQERVLAAAARRLAESSVDAATSLLGLVNDPEEVTRTRGAIAVVTARRDAKAALGLLQRLPEGSCRAESAFAAARACLAAGGNAEEALALAATAMDKDLARRWLLFEISHGGAANLTAAAEGIGNPYWEALGLVDAARVLAGAQAKAQRDLARAQLVRPIVAWESM